MIIKNLKEVHIHIINDSKVLVIPCDEYSYGDDQDDGLDEGDLYIYYKDQIRAILPYKKLIVQFIYE